jgi:DNA helicase IV
VTTFADRTARVDPGDLVSAPDYAEFGHIVVDEAQDLSVMQWRMVARRGREAGWTVVGDLAQRSTPNAPTTWADVARLIGARDVEVAPLSVNYRTSQAIMDLASRLLPTLAREQRPPRSVRPGTTTPTIVTGAVDLRAAVREQVEAARALARGTVGVVASSRRQADLAEDLADLDVRRFDPWTVKGLEFDAVVVVEPDEIVEDAGGGALYVALTRATEHLSIVTAAPDLPPALSPAA